MGKKLYVGNLSYDVDSSELEQLFGAHGQVKPAGIAYSSINEGAIGSGAYYFNKYFGGEIIFVAHPDGNNDGLYTASAGPIFRAPMENFTLFAHGLAGGARLGGPNSDAGGYHNPYQWGPTLTAGGGSALVTAALFALAD